MTENGSSLPCVTTALLNNDGASKKDYQQDGVMPTSPRRLFIDIGPLRRRRTYLVTSGLRRFAADHDGKPNSA
jgi:hypothetical protein